MPSSLERRTFPAGTPIFREGEPGQNAYIVERGEVEITALRDGAPVRLAVLGERDIFGEMALIDDDLRSASAMALTDTKVVVVPRDRVRQGMEQADPLLEFLLHVALDRVRSTNLQLMGAASPPSTPGSTQHGREGSEYGDARDRAFERLALEDELRRACALGQLELWYQPIVDLQPDRQVVGYEALLRWRHPTRGVLPPSAFIPVAEATGLIHPIGRWVLQEACRAIRRVDDDPATQGRYVTVNLAAQQLSDPTLVPSVEQILEETGATPDRLVLEITESELMENPEMARHHLTLLRDMGNQIFLDDFGTGYSSLSYLHRFPVTGLKLDGSFASSILAGDRMSEKIVCTIALLAEQMGLRAVAEGIEQEEQASLLSAAGFEYGQGYLFARPERDAMTAVRTTGEIALGGVLGG